MPRTERFGAATPSPSASIVITSKAGTHRFTVRDRLWVSGISLPVTEVRPGDLVAFLGRILAVQFEMEDSPPCLEKTAPQSDAAATSVAA